MFEFAEGLFTDVSSNDPEYERDVGWFNCDIEKYPDLKIPGVDGPNQVIRHRSALAEHILNFDTFKEENYSIDDVEGEAAQFAHDVFWLSGEWLHDVQCEEIMSPLTEEDEWEMVYFGTEDSLNKKIT